MLEKIKPAEGSTKDIKRVGRGQGSGMGKTSTRGGKGQKGSVIHSRHLSNCRCGTVAHLC